METAYSSETWLTFNGLHGVMHQMTELFTTTTTRTSNPPGVNYFEKQFPV
jgi:hypothetical protein